MNTANSIIMSSNQSESGGLGDREEKQKIISCNMLLFKELLHGRGDLFPLRKREPKGSMFNKISSY